MDQSGHMPGSTYIIMLVAIGLFVYRNMRPQKLTIWSLWLLPVFLILLTVLSVAATSLVSAPGFAAPTPAMTILAVAIGLAVGIPLGISRGRASQVRLGEKKGTIIVEPSLLFAAIWVAAFALRFGLRLLIPAASPAYFALSDASIVFAASAIVSMRYLLFRKFQALHVRAAEVAEG